MTALAFYDDISFEETVSENNIQIVITVNDKKSVTSRVVFDKTMPMLGFIPLFILISIPFFTVLFFIKLILNIGSLFHKEKPEMTYQEAKEYFASGKGYLNNLSDEDKRKLFTRRKNAPLGL